MRRPVSFQRPFTRLILSGTMLALLFTGTLSLSGCNFWHRDDGLHSAENYTSDVVTLFFSKYQGNQSVLDEVVRKLPNEAKDNPLQFAVSELLKGPTSEEKTQGYYSEIPQGTKLLGLSEGHDNTVVVNLSSQFNTGGGSNSMEQRFEELKKTVYSVDRKHTLAITVDGKPLDTLGGEGLEVNESAKREQQ
jgi:spore germination protein GerM